MPRYLAILTSLPVLWCSAFARGELTAPHGPPPAADYELIDPLANATDRSARQVWEPMEGTEPVSVVEVEGRKFLRMPCNLKGTSIDRASWDRQVELDLTGCQGVQFYFYCRDTTPVSGFSLYLRSGNGWYAARFAQTVRGDWSKVKVRKSQMKIEGSPAGWGEIETIRISAWRARDVDTEFYLSGLGRLGTGGPIAVIRGESVVENAKEEQGAVFEYARIAAGALESLELAYAMMSDLDVAEGKLKGKRIAILPHNPRMPDRAVDALQRFMAEGGKVLAMYNLPPKLRPIVGIEGGTHIRQEYAGYFSAIRVQAGALKGAPDAAKQRSWNIQESRAVPGRSRVLADWEDENGEPTGHAAVVASESCMHLTHVLLTDDRENKNRLLMSMLGHLLPELWEQSARKKIEGIGVVGPFLSFKEAVDSIRGMPGRREVTDGHLRRASELRSKAQEFLGAGEFPGALALAGEANTELLHAYCSAQQPAAGEFRAFWCHSAFGVAGVSWDEAVKNLADNGFTAVVPNMLWGGNAYYESSVLPVSPEVGENGDQIAACIAACDKYGLQCHVWKVNWNMSRHAPAAFADRMKREDRIQVSFSGAPEPRWLCPSHPENQKLEVESMVEVARKYDVDGIHFDYIRYPGPQHCFCSGCRTRFETATGAKVRNWPGEVRKRPDLRRKWQDFRRSNITAVVKAVHETARKVRPGIKISAAVFRNWQVDRDNVAQDWKLWCEKGYLDFVCPMDYTSSKAQFENMVEQQLEWSGAVPCYPGIGVSTWRTSDEMWRLIDQINITRRLKTGGFIIFNYGFREAKEIVPLCGEGITRRATGAP